MVWCRKQSTPMVDTIVQLLKRCHTRNSNNHPHGCKVNTSPINTVKYVFTHLAFLMCRRASSSRCLTCRRLRGPIWPPARAPPAAPPAPAWPPMPPSCRRYKSRAGLGFASRSSSAPTSTSVEYNTCMRYWSPERRIACSSNKQKPVSQRQRTPVQSRHHVMHINPTCFGGFLGYVWRSDSTKTAYRAGCMLQHCRYVQARHKPASLRP